jgi:hypothetical protein
VTKVNVVEVAKVVVVEVAKVKVDVDLEETFKFLKKYMQKPSSAVFINGEEVQKKDFFKPMFGTCW